MASYSAYIPCYNNADTVRLAVESVLAQTIPPSDVFVMDDGSIDASAEQFQGLPVTVVRGEGNRGRGAVRAAAMLRCGGDYVLCCDATNRLERDHAERALAWLADERVGAVCGGICQTPGGGAVRRWRGRHLFKCEKPAGVARGASLATLGAMVRRSAVLEAGNFDARLRHSEDAELGARLLAGGWDVVRDPSLRVWSTREDSLSGVLERYWRWYAGPLETVSLNAYARNVWYSWRAMIPADLREGDGGAAFVSFLAPHAQFWISVFRRKKS